jgi:hypothetical protein
LTDLVHSWIAKIAFISRSPIAYGYGFGFGFGMNAPFPGDHDGFLG